MNERYRMHRLSSTRLLAERTASSPSVKPQERQAVLFGELNFDTSMDDMALYAQTSFERGVNKSLGSGASDFDFQRTTHGLGLWGYLPGTLTEVEQDEMKRSGLVFAGANNFWSGAQQPEDMDDGILTAAEIARMNLQTTSLVVMSACQSGLGEVTGEGVFGLQRAFKKAGVSSLLISLWEVDDQATQLMMTHFYQALTEGNTKQQALATAQAAVRAQRFTSSDGSIHKGAESYYWAAFVLMDAD